MRLLLQGKHLTVRTQLLWALGSIQTNADPGEASSTFSCALQFPTHTVVKDTSEADRDQASVRKRGSGNKQVVYMSSRVVLTSVVGGCFPKNPRRKQTIHLAKNKKTTFMEPVEAPEFWFIRRLRGDNWVEMSTQTLIMTLHLLHLHFIMMHLVTFYIVDICDALLVFGRFVGVDRDRERETTQPTPQAEIQSVVWFQSLVWLYGEQKDLFKCYWGFVFFCFYTSF